MISRARKTKGPLTLPERPKSREETPKKGDGKATPIASPHVNNMAGSLPNSNGEACLILDLAGIAAMRWTRNTGTVCRTSPGFPQGAAEPNPVIAEALPARYAGSSANLPPALRSVEP